MEKWLGSLGVDTLKNVRGFASGFGDGEKKLGSESLLDISWGRLKESIETWDFENPRRNHEW